MALYTPFELVHAHLAETSAVEVAVPSERSFPATEHDYNTPLHAEHALSASFDAQTGTLARSVFNGYALELRSLSLVINSKPDSSPSVLRIVLPDPLRPLANGCIIPDFGAGVLIVLVVTTADVIYRFTFPLSGFSDAGDRVILQTKDTDWAEEIEIGDETINAAGGIASWAAVNQNTVMLGCSDGGIIKVARLPDSTPENPIWTASHHRGHSRLRLGFFSRGADETVTSLAEFDYQDQIPVLYSLSRDSKLRTWSSVSGLCLKTLDVRLSSQDLVPATQVPGAQPSAELSTSLIRVVRHPNPSSRCSHIVVVFIPTPYNPSVPGTFVFYRASHPTSGANDLVYAGERAGSPASAGSELRGFEIQPPSRTDAADGWRLWAVWDAKGKLEADSVPINDILQFTTYHAPPTKPRMVFDWQRAACYDGVERYDTSYFDAILSLDPPDPAQPYANEDISDVFVKHLLHPGRFSSLDLTTALDDYIAHLPILLQERARSVVYPSLAERFKGAVGSALTMKMSPQTGAPVVREFRAELKQQWLGIWARVCELDKQGRWPVATTCIDGQLVIVDREGASTPVQEDTSAVLVHHGQVPQQAAEFQTLPEGALRALYPALAPPKARRAITATCVAGESLSTLLRNTSSGDGSVSALDALFSHLDSELSVPASVPPEELAGGLWDDFMEPYLTEETRAHVTRALAESSSIPRTLADILEILSSYPAAASGSQKVDNWSLSGFGNALLASTVSAVIASRFALARDVLLVALYHTATSSDLAEDDDASETLIAVIARAQVTYHRYRVLSWLSQRSGTREGDREIQKRNGRDDVLAAFGSLKMRENEDKGIDSDGYDTAYSLLHSLLAQSLRPQAPRDTLAGLFNMASSLLADLSLVGSEQFDVEPRAADVKLAFIVLADGHAATAVDLTELYPMSSGTAYVRGLALLEIGDVERGANLLERASAGCRDGSLQVINHTWRSKKALGDYFLHVLDIVKQRELWVPVARFGERALQTIDQNGSDAKTVWTSVFLAYLQLGQFEDAYATLTDAPRANKRDLLGQLISAMCEANEIGRLNSLGFIGFQKEVEELLNYKARNSDPLRAPNYYEVLYSWHISRGDYRSAGETMYAQANRYAEVSSKLNRTQVAALRARSFLAAINALSLVDKRNAWITIHSPRAAKRRRVTSYIPEEAFSATASTTDIVTLADMRSEYRAILSQLQLAPEVPDLLAGNVSLAPTEIVGFFTQRDKFDEAFLAAAEMHEDMTDIFTALATRCVELSRGARRDDARAAFLRAPATARLRGPPSALALRYLQIALARHDSAATRWKYTAAVADTLFALNEDAAAGWAMPAWLVQAELARDAAGWIARALRFGWVREAVEWSADALRAEATPEARDASADTPFNLYDRVLAACKDGEESGDERLQAASRALRQSVERRVADTRKVAKV
ncbi:hypothetical protein CC85DRAFT_277004 [Cutaneotrichosporon oleaginosum]|uniref:Nuclear pore complex protein Nup160 n=1 Tax=Cutaneotrichosporon oleaginosum TaxID=879819 RepID=A0A0J0XIE3_9TREE|nr:uncharacterized protein CC85DRAFT_277004 [Cutaneotrichosporon oleaginosum]KLT40853.1 hypothetical protein CC85DRAFT_277004 [Cutaneotrichosporon oleaginosum]TXT09287.1 hypothetical protein COLE_03221 [Cutaneotrichosporon oleaginosum]